MWILFAVMLFSATTVITYALTSNREGVKHNHKKNKDCEYGVCGKAIYDSEGKFLGSCSRCNYSSLYCGCLAHYGWCN